MDFKKLIYTVEDGIAIITMDYMKNLNAIDEQMADELLLAFRAAEKDEAVKVVILKGQEKAFSAGGDIGYFYDLIKRAGCSLTVTARAEQMPSICTRRRGEYGRPHQ